MVKLASRPALNRETAGSNPARTTTWYNASMANKKTTLSLIAALVAVIILYFVPQGASYLTSHVEFLRPVQTGVTSTSALALRNGIMAGKATLTTDSPGSGKTVTVNMELYRNGDKVRTCSQASYPLSSSRTNVIVNCGKVNGVKAGRSGGYTVKVIKARVVSMPSGDSSTD